MAAAADDKALEKSLGIDEALENSAFEKLEKEFQEVRPLPAARARARCVAC